MTVLVRRTTPTIIPSDARNSDCETRREAVSTNFGQLAYLDADDGAGAVFGLEVAAVGINHLVGFTG